MCVTAIVIAAASVVTAGVGAYASIKSGQANAASAAYASKLEMKQADEQRAAAEIQAIQQENARNDAFQRSRSSALAAIGAAGLGEHISFFQSIDPEAQNAFLQDVRNVRLNLTQTRSTLRDQVQVSEFRSDIARYNSKLNAVGAIAQFVQTAASAYSMYSSNQPGKPAPT